MWWLGSRVVSVLCLGPGFKSQPRHCRVTVLGKRFIPIVPPVHQAAKLVAALLMVVRVTAGLAESNGRLPPGLWLTSPAGWLPRTGISCRTLRSAIEYGLPSPLYQMWATLCMPKYAPKVPIPMGDLDPHLIHGFLVVTNRQTHRRTGHR